MFQPTFEKLKINYVTNKLLCLASKVMKMTDEWAVESELRVGRVGEGNRGDYKCTASNTFGSSHATASILEPSEFQILLYKIINDFGDKIVIKYVEKYISDKQLLYD